MKVEDLKLLLEREKYRNLERESDNMSMGFIPKSKVNNTNNSENWGMGFLLIFFPEEEEKKSNFSFTNSSSSSSSSSLLPSFSFKSINAIRNRSSSSHLISKAQSTISICVLLIFITLLLFTLSTFEPTNSLNQKRKPPNLKFQEKLIFPPALQGMGSLYRRGTRAMNDLIVAHVIESVTEIELKMFLRLLHRSGITSKSDILFVFSSKSSSFDHAIVEENKSFLKLINGYYKYSKEEKKKNYNSSSDPTRFVNSSFDPTQFVISSKKEKESGEPIWGKKIQVYEDFGNSTELTLTGLSYGSVVGFDTGELDPENSLSGFLDHVPMSLRRWACYPMLLGRVRRNYKHVLLVDVKEHFVLGDSLSQLKNRSPESVILTTLPTRKKNSEKKLVNSGFVFGGVRGVRRLANAMLTEIVRAIMQHKKRNSVSESTLFNQLVANEFVLKNVNLIVSGESTHELSSVTGLMNSNSKLGSSSFSISKFPIVRRGNSNLDISYVFKKYLCSSPLDSIAYSDC